MNSSQLPFDLAYLGLLTVEGIKPLSRWEAECSKASVDWLSRLDLEKAHVKRELADGGVKRELVFSRSRALVDLYRERFDGKPIERSPATKRFEGHLFGYPGCCVEHYIRNGYAPNGLPERDQRLLFHWACPGCELTPLLLPAYRKAYAEACKLVGRGPFAGRSKLRLRLGKVKPSVITATLALSFGLVGGVTAQDLNPHLLALPDSVDQNHNYLADRAEEGLLDVATEVDGPSLAKQAAAAIHTLPSEPRSDGPYVQHFLQYGLEQCSVCDSTANMGFLVVTNPVLDERAVVPYIALHYLEHGSFSYYGGFHRGRIHLLRLLRVLGFSDGIHLLQLSSELDADDDGLPDAAELRLGLDPQAQDTDGNGEIDGVPLALDWAAEIDRLPRFVPGGLFPDGQVYRVDYEQDGLETCAVCGETVNMGFFEIVNPFERFAMSMPYIALHYLQHGSFAFDGDVHGRSLQEPRGLDCALHSGGGYHQMPIDGDADGDGLTDLEESRLGTSASAPDTDGDGIPDGRQLAWEFKRRIDGLPREPRSDQPFLHDFAQRGIETCEICGQSVNMGYVRVVNPVVGDSLDVPYIGLHVLEHGAFTYNGSLHEKGRVDPVRLAAVLGIQTSAGGNGSRVPRQFVVMEACPSQFAASTTITIQVSPKAPAGALRVDVYDILARRVRTFDVRLEASGTARIEWDGLDQAGRRLPNGLYLVRAAFGGETAVTRVVLVR